MMTNGMAIAPTTSATAVTTSQTAQTRSFSIRLLTKLDIQGSPCGNLSNTIVTRLYLDTKRLTIKQ